MKHSQAYSILKASEGGAGQAEKLRQLKAAGIEAKRDYSPYVGQSGILVYGGKRVQARASRILFNR
jgi:hypothetical protein